MLWRPETLAGFVRKLWRVGETLKHAEQSCKDERVVGYRAEMRHDFERHVSAAC
jgi:hypothetical protein